MFAYNDPAKAHPPASETVAASSDAGKPLGNDSAPSTQVKVVKEQLVDPIAQASPAHLPAGESEEVGLIPQAAGGSSTKLVEPKVETSAKTSLSSPPPTQSPDLRPARMASSTPEATKGAAVPPKRAGKLAARVGVATEATTPRGTMETTDELRTPAKPEPAKPDKEARAPQAAQAAAESTAPETASPEAARQPPNPLLQALGDLFGARSSRARQAVDPTPTASTGWAVQLATSKTEAEAKRVLKRLNAKYASALNGSTIRLHKARVSGETVYRLRVAGLSEADAAALCSRLKGDGGICSIVR